MHLKHKLNISIHYNYCFCLVSLKYTRCILRYSKNCIVVELRYYIVLQIDEGLVPSSETPFNVYNIGRTPVYAETIYGTKISWIGSVSHADVLPGETKVLPNHGKAYFVLGLQIYNRTNIRAIVSADQNFPAVSKHDNSGIDINYNIS